MLVLLYCLLKIQKFIIQILKSSFLCYRFLPDVIKLLTESALKKAAKLVLLVMNVRYELSRFLLVIDGVNDMPKSAGF
jgi:hypothetical protein